MGKVGSDSIASSLGKGSVEHFHTLYGMNPNDRSLSNDGVMRLIKKNIFYTIKRWLIKRETKVKIITLVRDPLERDISMFFQDINAFISKKRSFDYDSYVKFNSGGIEVLVDLFDELYDFKYGQEWFEKELFRFTGINIYNKPLVNGHSLYSNGKYEVLCIDMNSINSLEDVISKFCQRKVKIVSRNRSTEKWYQPIYTLFKDRVLEDRERFQKKYHDSKFNKWYN